MLAFDVLESFVTIISVIAILGSIAMTVTLSRESSSKAAKKHVADFFGYGALTNNLRALMNDKFTKQQTEVVARIVWRNSQVPLTSILKVPKERYNIYRGLSDPNQYPWDTEESEYI